jgi:type IV pilus assembly protein PilP
MRRLILTVYRLVFPLVFVLMTSGCSGGSNQDLVKYMQDVHQRPAKPIEPIPTFKEYRSFTYSSAGMRSPFDPPVELIPGIDNALSGSRTTRKPDPTRPKEYLENFSIGSISMVGTISKGGGLWALVNDGTGNVHRVTKGNYLGRNLGQIVGITNTEISLVELVPDGGNGWVERPKILKLVESKDQ